MKMPYTVIPFAIIAIFAMSCAKNDKDAEVIAKVNSSPITLKEFQRELINSAERNPNLKLTEEFIKEELSRMVEKKLMIEEAVKTGISEDERFIETIKIFWEQTLLRELIDKKTAEWKDTELFVTEEEIKKDYAVMLKDKMGAQPPASEVYDEIRTDIFERKKEKAFEKWLRELKGSSKIEIDEELIFRLGHGG